MECRDCQKRIPEYLAGCLPPGEVSLLTDHLNRCQACRKALAEFRELDRMIDAVNIETPEAARMDEIMADLTAGIMRQVAAEASAPLTCLPVPAPTANRRRRMLSLVQDLIAAAAAAIIIFWFSGPVLMEKNVPGYSQEVIRVSNSVGGAFEAYLHFPALALDKISDSIQKIGPDQMKGDEKL